MLMMRRSTLAVLGAICAVAPIRAHHSHGNYDLTVWTTMSGEVKELHLLVPHSWIYLDVKDDKGQVTTWALEATGAYSAPSPGGDQVNAQQALVTRHTVDYLRE